jgi:hypothetical protein
MRMGKVTCAAVGSAEESTRPRATAREARRMELHVMVVDPFLARDTSAIILRTVLLCLEILYSARRVRSGCMNAARLRE